MASEMIGLVEHAVSQCRWAILTFHGIHEGHLSVAEGDFAALCAHLGRRAAEIWTAPVADVARHLREAQRR